MVQRLDQRRGKDRARARSPCYQRILPSGAKASPWAVRLRLARKLDQITKLNAPSKHKTIASMK